MAKKHEFDPDQALVPGTEDSFPRKDETAPLSTIVPLEVYRMAKAVAAAHDMTLGTVCTNVITSYIKDLVTVDPEGNTIIKPIGALA